MESGIVVGSSITVALSIDLLLTSLVGCLPYLSRLLPIGGSHLSQLGFLLSISIAFAHLWQVFWVQMS